MALTDEDKVWFTAQLAAALGSERENTAAMFAHEREYIDTKFAAEREYIDSRFAQEREHTDAMFAQEREYTAAMFAREREHTDAMFAQERESVAKLLAEVMRREREITNAALEHLETRLLTAFHQWASPMEMRARSHAAALRALDVELESVSERVKKLEDPK